MLLAKACSSYRGGNSEKCSWVVNMQCPGIASKRGIGILLLVGSMLPIAKFNACTADELVANWAEFLHRIRGLLLSERFLLLFVLQGN